jgi:virginiamycin B lyase
MAGPRITVVGLLLCLGLLACAQSAVAAVKTYDVGSDPGRMVRAADGAIWFTKSAAVGRITTTGATRTFSVRGAGSGSGTEIMGVAVGPDGTVWATAASGGIARIDPAGPVATFAPAAAGLPTGIVVAPDGLVWFSDSARGSISRFDGASTFAETLIGSIPGPDFRADPAAPTELIVGPDNAVWILHLTAGRIGRMTLDTALTSFVLPSGAASAPTGIALGPDGALWITEAGINKIARMTLDGLISEWPIPSRQAEPRAITAGPDGAMWFTEYATDRVGRITPSGKVTEYALPKASQPYGIVAGADDAIWVTLRATGKIARLTTDTPPTATAATRAKTKKKKHKPRHRAHRHRAHVALAQAGSPGRPRRADPGGGSSRATGLTRRRSGRPTR